MGSNPDNSTAIFNSSGPGAQYYYDDSAAKFNPTTAVVIISLIGGCFVLAFVSVVLRKYIRGDSGLTTLQSSTTQSGSYNVKSKGLQKADVDALPLVHREDLDEKYAPRECPVCLTDFESADTLRLLPTCKHVFHRECIDAWFDAHSTCPLCRASLLGQPVGETKPSNLGGEHVAAPDGHGESVETITEVSESGDSDVEARQPTSSDVPLDDSRTATLLSREDSARVASLFRKSGSSNCVTTGIDQQLITKSSSFRKLPASSSIRRSSSLSADLIALRNLLMRQSDQNVDAPSRRWFSRARSLDLAPRDRVEGDEWVTIDLETGKAANNLDAQVPSSSHSSKGESSKGPPERAWSERWSLASLKGAVIFPLTRSTSDVSSRSAHLPI